MLLARATTDRADQWLLLHRPTRQRARGEGSRSTGAICVRLIELIGLETVDAMENDNAPHKWTREGLIEVRDTYRAKLKDIQKGET